MNRVFVLSAFAWVLSSATAVAAPASFRCGTLDHLHEARELIRNRPARLPGPFQGGPGVASPLDTPVLSERDGFNVVVGAPAVKSDHFILRWGANRNISESTAQAILAGLEVAWQVEVVEHGYPQPYGTQTYYLNAYVGNSGGGAPSIDFVGAYVTTDREGFPYIAIHPSLFQDINTTNAVTAHEFFHTIQFTTDAFSRFEERSNWYWEATAEWMAAKVYPNGDAEDKVGAFVIAPQLALFGFETIDSGETLLSYRPYGATIFPMYLSDIVADDSIILESWTEPTGDVMETLAAVLAARSFNLPDTFASFAAHTAVLDFARASKYKQSVQQYSWYFKSDEATVAVEIPTSGTATKLAAPTETLPEAYGFNTLLMKSAGPGSYTFRVEGEPTGTLGNTASFRATLVRVSGGKPTYTIVPFTGNVGELTVSEVEKSSLYLVVAATPENAEFGETFTYSYETRWDPPAPAPLPENPPSVSDPAFAGCTMTTATAPVARDGALGVMLFALVALLVSRRAARRARA